MPRTLLPLFACPFFLPECPTHLFPDQFGYYTHEGQRMWNIEPGTYTVKVGASSADIRLEQQVELKGKLVSKPLRNKYFSETVVFQ